MPFRYRIVGVIESKDQSVNMIDINVVLVTGISGATAIDKLTVFNGRFAIRNISTQDAHLISIKKTIGNPKIGSFLANTGTVMILHHCIGEFNIVDVNIGATDDKDSFTIGHIISDDTSGFEAWTPTDAGYVQIVFIPFDLWIIDVGPIINENGIPILYPWSYLAAKLMSPAGTYIPSGGMGDGARKKTKCGYNRISHNYLQKEVVLIRKQDTHLGFQGLDQVFLW